MSCRWRKNQWFLACHLCDAQSRSRPTDNVMHRKTRGVIETNLISKVRSLDHSAEQADLDHSGEHLDARQELWYRAVSKLLISLGIQERTSWGFRMYSSPKGASMQKFPLSVTIGPAFILAIRRTASVEPVTSMSGSWYRSGSAYRVCAGFVRA